MAHAIQNNKCFVFMKKRDAGPGPGPEKTTNARQERAKNTPGLAVIVIWQRVPAPAARFYSSGCVSISTKEERDNVFCLTWQVFLSSFFAKFFALGAAPEIAPNK
ncbi:hypothetical protein LJC15_04085 [Desulfovibrio sp. OttesenSCG-928-G11]|nr:hypothetical protein [Desulfovibrio sp. OttesenSCG-928-G11]